MNSLDKKNQRENSIEAGQTWIPQPHYQRTGKKPLHIVEVVRSESGVIAVVRIGSATVPKTVTGKRIINHYSLRRSEEAPKVTTAPPVSAPQEIKKRRRNSAQVAAHAIVAGQVWVAQYGGEHVHLVEVGENICGIRNIDEKGNSRYAVRAVKHQTLRYKYRFVSDTVEAYVETVSKKAETAAPEPVEVNGEATDVSDEVIKEFSDRFSLSLKNTMQNTMQNILSELVADIIRTEIRAAVEKAMAPYERQNLDKTINEAVKSAMAPYDAALRSLIGG